MLSRERYLIDEAGFTSHRVAITADGAISNTTVILSRESEIGIIKFGMKEPNNNI